MPQQSTIYNGQRYATQTLVTDTLCYDVIGSTARTIKVRRRTRDESKPPRRDTLVDQGPWPVMWYPTQEEPDAEVKTLRLRKDGTYRTAGWAHPLHFTDVQPEQRVDYRM